VIGGAVLVTGLLAGPGRAGLGQDPRRSRHGLGGDRPFPCLHRLADPPRDVVRERGDRPRPARSRGSPSRSWRRSPRSGSRSCSWASAS
jgi:hypothetical protein